VPDAGGASQALERVAERELRLSFAAPLERQSVERAEHADADRLGIATRHDHGDAERCRQALTEPTRVVPRAVHETLARWGLDESDAHGIGLHGLSSFAVLAAGVA
jgi:hypothetical protein